MIKSSDLRRNDRVALVAGHGSYPAALTSKRETGRVVRVEPLDYVLVQVDGWQDEVEVLIDHDGTVPGLERE